MRNSDPLYCRSEWLGLFLSNLVNSEYYPTGIDISLKTTNVFLMLVLEAKSGSPKSLGLEKWMFAQNFVCSPWRWYWDISQNKLKHWHLWLWILFNPEIKLPATRRSLFRILPTGFSWVGQKLRCLQVKWSVWKSLKWFVFLLANICIYALSETYNMIYTTKNKL